MKDRKASCVEKSEILKKSQGTQLPNFEGIRIRGPAREEEEC